MTEDEKDWLTKRGFISENDTVDKVITINGVDINEFMICSNALNKYYHAKGLTDHIVIAQG